MGDATVLPAEDEAAPLRPELHEMICEYVVDRKSLAELCLANKAWYEVASLRLLREIDASALDFTNSSVYLWTHT
jgi:hypothetical protein